MSWEVIVVVVMDVCVLDVVLRCREQRIESNRES